MAFKDIFDFLKYCKDTVKARKALRKDYLWSLFEILDDKGSIQKLSGLKEHFITLKEDEFESLMDLVYMSLKKKPVSIEVDGVLLMHSEEEITDSTEMYLGFLKSQQEFDELNAINEDAFADSYETYMKSDGKVYMKKRWESLPVDEVKPKKPSTKKVAPPKSSIVTISITL